MFTLLKLIVSSKSLYQYCFFQGGHLKLEGHTNGGVAEREVHTNGGVAEREGKSLVQSMETWRIKYWIRIMNLYDCM